MKKQNITALIIALMVTLLTECTARSPSATPGIAPVPPAAEPEWLSILYPERGEILLLSAYDQERGFGTKSSICFEISADDLVEAGDYWEADDVVERTVVFVDDVQRYQSGDVYDYLVGHLFDDRDVGGPFGFCVSAPVRVGVHRVDISFKKSSGMTPAFSWSFEIVENSIPTATSLPVPRFTDKKGDLPPYLRAVYPMPGQVVSLEKYGDVVPKDKTVWQSSSLNEKAICIALKMDKLKDVGSLPSDLRDSSSRIYVKVDENLPENLSPWESIYKGNRIHCMPGVLTLGYHTVTLYIDPYDKKLVMYSWGFTITK